MHLYTYRSEIVTEIAFSDSLLIVQYFWNNSYTCTLNKEVNG